MLGIGQFAQLAKVSVRTLRYYGDNGLFKAAHVDPHSGYRSYEIAQLVELNRIIVLKELGFSLDEIVSILAEGVTTEDLIAMAKQRREDAAEQIEVEQRRLAQVAARIDLLKGNDIMDTTTASIVVKALDPLRLATASETVTGFDADLAGVYGRLYPLIFQELERLGVSVDYSAPTASLHEVHDDGIEIIAAVQIPADLEFTSEVIERRDIPAARKAATVIHAGAMDTVHQSHQALFTWVEAAGEEPVGLSRELYLQHDGPQDTWVTELQLVLQS